MPILFTSSLSATLLNDVRYIEPFAILISPNCSNSFNLVLVVLVVSPVMRAISSMNFV